MESITYHRGSLEIALKNGSDCAKITKLTHTSAVVEGTALVWHIQTQLLPRWYVPVFFFLKWQQQIAAAQY